MRVVCHAPGMDASIKFGPGFVGIGYVRKFLYELGDGELVQSHQTRDGIRGIP